MPVAKETADWLVDRIIRRLLMSSNEAVVNLIFALARVCFDLCLAGTCTTVWYTGGLHSRQISCCVQQTEQGAKQSAALCAAAQERHTTWRQEGRLQRAREARKDRQQDRRDEVRCSHVHEPVLGLTTLKIRANLTTHTKRKVDQFTWFFSFDSSCRCLLCVAGGAYQHLFLKVC